MSEDAVKKSVHKPNLFVIPVSQNDGETVNTKLPSLSRRGVLNRVC